VRAVTGPASRDDDLAQRVQSALGAAYCLERVLGEGGFAVVYGARDRALNRPVAIKVLRPELAGAATIRERFRREAEAIATARRRAPDRARPRGAGGAPRRGTGGATVAGSGAADRRAGETPGGGAGTRYASCHPGYGPRPLCRCHHCRTRGRRRIRPPGRRGGARRLAGRARGAWRRVTTWPVGVSSTPRRDRRQPAWPRG